MTNMKHKTIAKAKKAGKTNGKENSLVKCEVNLEKGRWIQPQSCQKFYIDKNADFPDIVFEIETDEPAPYKWSWEIHWKVMACPQKDNKPRFNPKKSKTFSDKGSFSSDSKQWKADLNSQVIGGELTVRVAAGSDIFIRKIQILGKQPSQAQVDAEIGIYASKYPTECDAAKKIFKQESRYRQFYTDEMPLVSFDNGYGLGQATDPVPTYEQAWNWKASVKYIITDVIHAKRNLAKKYLDQHGSYTNNQLETETFVYYNGANYHYYIWDAKSKRWTENTNIMCDPDQSNSGWNMSLKKNQGKTLSELQQGKGTGPIYIGRCYAKHIQDSR